jgi:peroxiredoxin
MERANAVTFLGNPLTLVGNPVSPGDLAPDATVLKQDLTLCASTTTRGTHC